MTEEDLTGIRDRLEADRGFKRLKTRRPTLPIIRILLQQGLEAGMVAEGRAGVHPQSARSCAEAQRPVWERGVTMKDRSINQPISLEFRKPIDGLRLAGC